MGESFYGFPNRFQVVNTLEDMEYYPHRALSSYMGYKLAKTFEKYLPLEGGKVTGLLETSHISPHETNVYNIGTEMKTYKNIYANTFHGNLSGNANTASELYTSRKIAIQGSVSGDAIFDGSEDIAINVETSHGHDNTYLKLTGGTLTGNLALSQNASIVGTNNRYLLTLTTDNVLQLNKGTYNQSKGNTTIYTSGDLDVRTHSSGITITSSLFDKTVNVGTASDSVFLQNTSGNDYVHVTDDGKLLFNTDEVYHEGNFDAKNTLGATYKQHMDEVEKIIKVLAITLDALEVAVGNKEQLDYPGQSIGDDLLYYKNSAMNILGNITQEGD